jgi:hypothetical protein
MEVTLQDINFRDPIVDLMNFICFISSVLEN